MERSVILDRVRLGEWGVVNGSSAVEARGDDEGDAQAGESRDNGERQILLLDQFLPQVVRREFIDEDEAEAEDGDACDGKNDGREEAVEKGLGVHGSLVLRAEEGGSGARAETAAEQSIAAHVLNDKTEANQTGEQGVNRGGGFHGSVVIVIIAAGSRGVR